MEHNSLIYQTVSYVSSLFCWYVYGVNSMYMDFRPTETWRGLCVWLPSSHGWRKRPQEPDNSLYLCTDGDTEFLPGSVCRGDVWSCLLLLSYRLFSSKFSFSWTKIYVFFYSLKGKKFPTNLKSSITHLWKMNTQTYLKVNDLLLKECICFSCLFGAYVFRFIYPTCSKQSFAHT